MFMFTAFQTCGNIAVGVNFKTWHISITVINALLSSVCSNVRVALLGIFFNVQDTLMFVSFSWFSVNQIKLINWIINQFISLR